MFWKKRDKKIEKEVGKDEIERNYDLIIVFIGYSIVLLGVLNSFKKVPDEFLFGTAIAGFFFAMSDFHLLKTKLYKSDVSLNMIFLFLGVASFFLLPVFLIVNHKIYLFVKPVGDALTFIALGIVVMGIGYKSSNSKRNYLNKMLTEILEIKSVHEEVKKELEKVIQELHDIKNDQ